MTSHTRQVPPSTEPLITPTFSEKDTAISPTQCDEEAIAGKRPQSQTSLVTESPSSKLTQVSSWTCIIVVGQLVILAIALAFFILIHFTHTPMQQNIAEWAKESPRGLAFCVTILATLLSSLSTFFFSKGLILYLTSHSNHPAPLINFLVVSNLSRGAPLFSRHHVSWTILSLLALILMNSLTASFTTILTPTPLVINVPVKGIEFDMFSGKYAHLVANPRLADLLPRLTVDQMRISRQASAVIGPLGLTSAYNSASRQLGYPGVISFLGTLFNSTTGGVVPAVPVNKEDALAADSDRPLDLNFRRLKSPFTFVDPSFKPSKKFPFNFTTIQQGFTVDVQCRVLSQSPAAHQAGLSVHFERNATLPDHTLNSLWRYSVQCPSQGLPSAPTNQSILIDPHGSMILSHTCPGTNFEGLQVPGSQLLILGGYGPMYSFISPRACEFTPYFTLAEVQYSNIANVSRIISREPITPANAPIASMIYGTVIDTMDQYAAAFRNKVGDDIGSLYGISSQIESTNDPLLNRILEAYLRGLVETNASITKTPPLAAGPTRLLAATLQDLSPEWIRTFDGIWSYETLGWHNVNESMKSTAIGIVPILLITIITIFLGLFSWLSLKGTRHLRNEPFDPNNLVTLLKAGRDGSVVDILGHQKNLDSTTGRDVRIQLHRNATQWQLRPARAV